MRPNIERGPGPDCNSCGRGEAAGRRVSTACGAAAIDIATDAYVSTSAAPVYRIACGDLWFHVDAASGVIIDRLDSSRRAQRWLFGALHTFEVPWFPGSPLVPACGARW